MSISEIPGFIFHQLRLSLEGRILTIILKNTIATSQVHDSLHHKSILIKVQRDANYAV